MADKKIVQGTTPEDRRRIIHAAEKAVRSQSSHQPRRTH